MSRPDLNQRGEPANRLLVWSLREHSHRSVRVAGVSAGDAPAHRPRIEGDRPDQERPRVPTATAKISLPERVRGFLGNLPQDAQLRLQEPFVNGDLVRESDYHYYGHPERLDIWCCLAGSRTVTFGSGTGVLVPGRTRAYSWDLTCRQAEVVGS
jgi:hypothetical protein